MNSSKEKFVSAERKSDSAVVFLLHDKKRDLFLIQRRSDDKPLYPGVRLIPGGHIEDETPLQALFREVREEVRVNVLSYLFLGSYKYIAYEGREKEAFLYYVPEWEGEIVNNSPEEGEIEWVSVNKLVTSLDVYESKAMVLMMFARLGILTAEHFQQMPDIPLPEPGVTIEIV